MNRRWFLTLALFSPVFAPCVQAADWPQWRGPDRTDVSTETGLMKKWPAEGPKLLWTAENLGIGHAGPAIADGKIFIMGVRDSSEVLICLDAASGKEAWVTPIDGVYGNKWGDGPRSTPTVDGKLVYAVSGKGTLICASTANGKVVWKENVGGQVQGWGFTQSPLVDEKLVYTYEGGKGSIKAYDKLKGKPAWRSDRFDDDSHYSSLIAIENSGVDQIVQLRMGSVVSVAAKTGKTVWKTDWPGKTAVIPTPIYHDGHVFVTSGYGVGCKLFQINKGATKDVYFNKDMKNHHGGVILVGDHLYGHSDGPGWVCMDFKSGEIKWREGKLGKGSVSCADGMLYLFDENDGTCVLIEASPEGWKEAGRFKLPKESKLPRGDGKIWVHPVISNGKLYLRDQEYFFCFDIKG